jgi:hypothetical protein
MRKTWTLIREGHFGKGYQKTYEVEGVHKVRIGYRPLPDYEGTKERAWWCGIWLHCGDNVRYLHKNLELYGVTYLHVSEQEQEDLTTWSGFWHSEKEVHDAAAYYLSRRNG